MQLKIDKLVPGGQGIGTLESGQKCFVWGGLPGEIVEFEVTKKKRSYLEGVVTGVVEASEYRVEPRDECYLATSPWQVMDYEYELRQKSKILDEIFRQNSIDLTSGPFKTYGLDYFYRNKMEYSVYWDHDTEKIELAFHVRGTHRKIPVQSSSIERPEVLAEAKRILAGLNASGRQAREIQSIMVRCAQDGRVSSAVYENGKSHPEMLTLTDKLLGYEYTYSPNGFFQINLPVYEMALKEIAQWIETEGVLDLYAGVGTVGLSVARERKLTLVEVNGDAYRELERNAEGAGGQVETVLAKSEEALDFLKPDLTVIVDPPRAGCDEKLIRRLMEVKPERIIYLSCNPVTQARDMKLLLEGYKVLTAQGCNFFPRTPHIENLVVLSRK